MMAGLLLHFLAIHITYFCTSLYSQLLGASPYIVFQVSAVLDAATFFGRFLWEHCPTSSVTQTGYLSPWWPAQWLHFLGKPCQLSQASSFGQFAMRGSVERASRFKV